MVAKPMPWLLSCCWKVFAHEGIYNISRSMHLLYIHDIDKLDIVTVGKNGTQDIPAIPAIPLELSAALGEWRDALVDLAGVIQPASMVSLLQGQTDVGGCWVQV